MRFAESATRNSTFCESTALPWWRRTTRALEKGWASITRCWAAGVASEPWMSTSTGAATSVSCGTVSTVASVTLLHALAETRSSGIPALPMRASSRPTVSTRTASESTVTAGAGPVRASACSPLRRLSGVNRKSSSRPVSFGKSATS